MNANLLLMRDSKLWSLWLNGRTVACQVEEYNAIPGTRPFMQRSWFFSRSLPLQGSEIVFLLENFLYEPRILQCSSDALVEDLRKEVWCFI